MTYTPPKIPKGWGYSYGNSSFGFDLTISMPAGNLTLAKYGQAKRLAIEIASGDGIVRLSDYVEIIKWDGDGIRLNFKLPDDHE